MGSNFEGETFKLYKVKTLMKINLNFLKKEKVFKKPGVIIKPNLYWKFILYISFIIIFSSFVFGFYFFSLISNEDEVSSKNFTSYADKIKKERIQKVLKYFSDREDKSAKIVNYPAPVEDPSIVPIKTPPAGSVVPSVGIEPTSKP